jgi:hypothetical protein
MYKRWYTIKQHVDIETGEVLTESDVLRGNYLKVGKDERIEYKTDYNIKYLNYHYEQNNQTRIEF